MKKTVRVGAFATMLLMSLCAHAEKWHSDTIKHIYPPGDGRFILTLTTASVDCPAASPKGHYLAPGMNGLTVEGVRQIFTIVTAAAALDKQVQLAFDESTSYCYISKALLVVN